jgi:hypothetical protein
MSVEFERIVGVVNPECSEHKQGIAQLDEVIRALPADFPYIEIETNEDFVGTSERLAEVLQPDDLVAPVGGDGTKNAVMRAMLAKGGVMLPIPGGNGNDLERSLHGRQAWPSPLQLLREGEPVSIHPIQVAVEGMSTLYAINYFGIQATAKGSYTMDQSWYRNLPVADRAEMRAIYEFLLLPPIAFFSRPFFVKENDIVRMAVDMSFMNGSSMAKHGKPPVDIADPHLFMTECRLPLDLLPWAIRGVRGTMNGEYLEKGRQRAFRLGRTVLAHIDAQTFKIPEDREVTVSVAEKPFKALRLPRS